MGLGIFGYPKAITDLLEGKSIYSSEVYNWGSDFYSTGYLRLGATYEIERTWLLITHTKKALIRRQ